MTEDTIHCILHNNDVIFAWTFIATSKGMFSVRHTYQVCADHVHNQVGR